MAEIACVSVIVTRPDGKILLLRKSSEAVFSQPASKIEGSETPEEAAEREFGEETGLSLMDLDVKNNSFGSK